MKNKILISFTLASLLGSSLFANNIELTTNKNKTIISLGLLTQNSTLDTRSTEHGSNDFGDNLSYKGNIIFPISNINKYSEIFLEIGGIYNNNYYYMHYPTTNSIDKDYLIKDNNFHTKIGYSINIEDFNFQLSGVLNYKDYSYNNKFNQDSSFDSYFLGFELGIFKEIKKDFSMGINYSCLYGQNITLKEYYSDFEYNNIDMDLIEYGIQVPFSYKFTNNFSSNISLNYSLLKDNSSSFENKKTEIEFNINYIF